jgi:serine protease AprX
MKVFVRAKSESDVEEVARLHERTEPVISEADHHVVIADLPEDTIQNIRESDHFEVYDDIQFRPVASMDSGSAEEVVGDWWTRRPNEEADMDGPPPWHRLSQRDVMEHIVAPSAWDKSRGSDVTIAVVDSGTDGSMREFPRRSPHSYGVVLPNPWEDKVGHGTMCAAIACGSDEDGGRYNGVAPDANLLSARTDLSATDLYLIYQHLLGHFLQGRFEKGLVVSNSYGQYRCSAPEYIQGHPFVDIVRSCVQAGMVFVFAAGNNHGAGLCRHPEADDHPNTIWAVNSIDEVITVGTVDWEESNQRSGSEHGNSSRGPGQWSTRADKPDVVAPTYGEVAWGGQYQPMEWWGTSGACPQVAGLAALLISRDPDLTPDDIREVVRSTARRLPGKPQNCVGAGIIDCAGAIQSID